MWRLCSTEMDLLYSHECPSLTKITHRRPQLGSTMPRSGQRNSTVNPAAALQARAVLELQLNGIQALSHIPLHSSTGEINPETEPAKRIVHTTSEMTVWDLPCWSCGRGNYFSASLIEGIISCRNQDKHPSRTWTCCNAPPPSQHCCSSAVGSSVPCTDFCEHLHIVQPTKDPAKSLFCMVEVSNALHYTLHCTWKRACYLISRMVPLVTKILLLFI